jgi:hypothetical protein
MRQSAIQEERDMNNAEQRRNVRIAAMTDLELLELFRDADIGPGEYVAFANMRAEGRRLTSKQRAWAEEVARRITPIRASEAPRGAEVPTPAVLQNLPKKPPRRIVG